MVTLLLGTSDEVARTECVDGEDVFVHSPGVRREAILATGRLIAAYAIIEEVYRQSYNTGNN